MTVEDLPVLRIERTVVGTLNPLMRELQERAPILKVRTLTGDEAWLVTRYKEMKQLLLDKRLGNSHPDPPNRPRYLDNPMLDLLVSDKDHEFVRDSHIKLRNTLTPHFTPKRMAALQDRVAQRIDTLLDKIVTMDKPVDLNAELTVPLSFNVLCDLLGVEDRDGFLAMLGSAGSIDNMDDAVKGRDKLFVALAELVESKRAKPREDLISGLIETGVDNQEAAALVALVSFSYLVTPGNMTMGVALLAANPDQRDLLLKDRELVPGAVEEILRMGRTGESFMPRYASEDIEIGDVVIRTGELVLCDHYATNYDDRVFPDPERFDVTRNPNRHLAFSHGISHCIGAPLARLELNEMLNKLLDRLPGLELAVPLEDLRMLSDIGPDKLGAGLAELPVTW